MKIVFNGEEREFAAPLTIADLLQHFDLKSRHVAVEVNLELAPRARHGEGLIRDGDQIEVVTLVGGG